MDNWPFFEERFAPILKSEAPVYQDGLIVTLLFLLLATATLFVLRLRYKKDTFGLLFLLFSAIQSIFLVSVTSVLLLKVEPTVFWENIINGTYIITTLFFTQLIIYFWIWIAFSRGANKAVWYREYFKNWSYFGYSLFIPIVLLLLGPKTHWIALSIAGVSYLAYRIVILVQSLMIFPYLRGYPLHIILYLCTCEIFPLLFVFLGV